jgi:hypothetical protein
MTRITVNGELSTKLQELVEEVELCDPSGQVLGRFVPEFDMSQWEPMEPEISEEELQRREQSTEWYTTEEVLAYLKSLEKQ